MSTASKSNGRKRKAASRMLGIAVQQRLENLYAASGDTEVTIATVELAQVMYENAEFIVWALKSMGGLNPPVPAALKPIAATRPKPANDAEPVKLSGFKRVDFPADYEPVKVVHDPKLIVAEGLPVLPTLLTGNPRANECTCPPMEPGIIGYAHMASCPHFEPA